MRSVQKLILLSCALEKRAQMEPARRKHKKILMHRPPGILFSGRWRTTGPVFQLHAGQVRKGLDPPEDAEDDRVACLLRSIGSGNGRLSVKSSEDRDFAPTADALVGRHEWKAVETCRGHDQLIGRIVVKTGAETHALRCNAGRQRQHFDQGVSLDLLEPNLQRLRNLDPAAGRQHGDFPQRDGTYGYRLLPILQILQPQDLAAAQPFRIKPPPDEDVSIEQDRGHLAVALPILAGIEMNDVASDFEHTLPGPPGYHINIFFSDEDGGYIADIPDLAYCSAFGKTPEEALGL